MNIVVSTSPVQPEVVYVLGKRNDNRTLIAKIQLGSSCWPKSTHSELCTRLLVVYNTLCFCA